MIVRRVLEDSEGLPARVPLQSKPVLAVKVLWHDGLTWAKEELGWLGGRPWATRTTLLAG